MRPARYGLRADNGMPALAQWHGMDGFFVGRESVYDAYENPPEELQAVRVTLRDVEWLDSSTGTLTLSDAVLEVLAPNGHVLGDYLLWEAELSAAASPGEAILTARVEALPHVGGEWAWDLWRSGGPAQPTAWAGLPVGEREGWLEAARIVAFRERRTQYPPLGAEHYIDGSHIDDLASFFCAIGEAVAGPGGWYGSSFADLADQLRFSPRTVARPRLVWRDYAVAEKGLDHAVENGVRLLDIALRVFAEAQIEVVPT